MTGRSDWNASFKVFEGYTQVSIEEHDVAIDIREFVLDALKENEAIEELLCESAFRPTVIETVTSRAHGK